jgi:putative sterol carrier protein
MSEVIEKAVTALKERLSDGFDGTVKFVVEDEGAIMVDENGVRAADEEAECVLTSDSETLMGIMSGDLNPTAAFMTGKLKLDGDMGMAMKLGAALS